MTSEPDDVASLRAFWSHSCQGEPNSDYILLAEYRQTYAAQSRSGDAALIIPVASMQAPTTGRRASGLDLISHTSLLFSYRGREWSGPAAALVCTEPALLDTFAVLAADVVKRLGGSDLGWQSILDAIEEWQNLLEPRGAPNAEAELGLWGELWFLQQSIDVERTLAGWRGPEGDSTDFFVGRLAAEVKTSRMRGSHYVSQSQVDAPTGSCDAWLVSLWVKVDPTGPTVGQVVDDILARVNNKGEALKRIARAGFSPIDRPAYRLGVSLLAEPEWFCTTDVPRVRSADPGISQLRYRMSLDHSRRADRSTAERLWRTFHGQPFGGIR